MSAFVVYFTLFFFLIGQKSVQTNSIDIWSIFFSFDFLMWFVLPLFFVLLPIISRQCNNHCSIWEYRIHLRSIINYLWIDGQKFFCVTNTKYARIQRTVSKYSDFLLFSFYCVSFVCWFGNLIPCIKLKAIAIAIKMNTKHTGTERTTMKMTCNTSLSASQNDRSSIVRANERMNFEKKKTQTQSITTQYVQGLGCKPLKRHVSYYAWKCISIFKWHPYVNICHFDCRIYNHLFYNQ